VEGEPGAELAVNDVSLVLAVVETAGHQEIGVPADCVSGINVGPGLKILPRKLLDDLAEKLPREKCKGNSQYCLRGRDAATLNFQLSQNVLCVYLHQGRKCDLPVEK